MLERKLSTKRILIETAASIAIAYLIVDPIDKDFTNHLMYLPDWMHGRMLDFCAGVSYHSLSRLFVSKPWERVAYGAGAPTFREVAIDPILGGTFDTGDIVAFGLGAVAAEGINFLRSRGRQRWTVS